MLALLSLQDTAVPALHTSTFGSCSHSCPLALLPPLQPSTLSSYVPSLRTSQVVPKCSLHLSPIAPATFLYRSSSCIAQGSHIGPLPTPVTPRPSLRASDVLIFTLTTGAQDVLMNGRICFHMGWL